MKMFECDLCPKKLKCQLTNQKNKIMKKWIGNDILKLIWERVDKHLDEYNKGKDTSVIIAANIGLSVGNIGGMCKAYSKDKYKDYDKIFEDIKDCIKYVVLSLDSKD